MQISVGKEILEGEKRIAIVPGGVKKLVDLGARVFIEDGLGESIGIPNEEFIKVDAQIISDRRELFQQADLVFKIRKPNLEEISVLKKDAILISFLDPFFSNEVILNLAKNHITSLAMELIPRITKAQKMDALSSQANLAGYVSVILAAERINKIFPMMMTPAGTIAPVRVFIIGAGVAGLQAIATAKRLGARVDAFDTRPAVEEQVKSLGAKFVKVDLGETGETKDGYAKGLTEDQMSKQREVMAKQCTLSDVVITTAQVFGKKAPRIITQEMIKGMQPGSVLIDLAIETGGNIEGAKLDQEIIQHGVRIIGLGNLPGHVAFHASQMYSNNIVNLVAEFWNKNEKSFQLNLEDEIIKSALVTHQGEMVNSLLKDRI